MRLRVVIAMVVLAFSRVALAVFGFPRVRRLLSRSRPIAARTDDAMRARSWAKAVVRAGQRLPFRTTCLDRSVALWLLLRARRIGGEIRIGVRPGEPLEAHAWVEHAGVVVYDDEAPGFEAFDDPVLQ